MDVVLGLVESCARRLGQICMGAWTSECLNDPCDTRPSEQDLLELTHSALRRMLNSLLMLYRHIFLCLKALPPPPRNCQNQGEHGITKFHWEASSDDYNVLCMHMALPVGARLNYRHDFPGMYSNVSQAVYYHNPDYRRPPRVPWDSDLALAPALQVFCGNVLHVP